MAAPRDYQNIPVCVAGQGAFRIKHIEALKVIPGTDPPSSRRSSPRRPRCMPNKGCNACEPAIMSRSKSRQPGDREFLTAINEKREPNGYAQQILPAMRTLDALEKSLL